LILEEGFDYEGLTLTDPASKGLSYIPPLEEITSLFANEVLLAPDMTRYSSTNQQAQEEALTSQSMLQMIMEPNPLSFQSLHQSLEVLKSQLLLTQFNQFLQNMVQDQVQEEIISIPPLVLSSERSTMEIPFKDVTVDKVSKRLPKKLEEEMGITYGSVEFPLLSMLTSADNVETNKLTMGSTRPLLQINQNVLFNKGETKKEGEPVKRKYNKLFPSLKSTKGSQENQKKETKVAKKEIKSVKIETTEKRVTKDEKKSSTIKKVFTIVNENRQIQQKATKKNIKEEIKSSMEVEEAQTQTKEKKYVSLSHHFGKRRGEERRKNRWQVSQDNKLGDLQIPVLTLSSTFSMMFEGIKKKGPLVPVGNKYQVDLGSFLAKGDNPRQPKLKWDPSSHKEADVQRLFRDVEALVDVDTNQEKIISYLLKNKNDMKKTKKYIKDNKNKVSQDMVLKALD